MGLVLFDGVCALCDSSVRALLAIDKKHALQFAPLQGTTAARLLETNPTVDRDLSTILYVRTGGDADVILERSDAAFAILADVGGFWSVLSVLRFIPRPLRDGVYAFIARRRYRWFGKFESCRLPRPEEKARFLD